MRRGLSGHAQGQLCAPDHPSIHLAHRCCSARAAPRRCRYRHNLNRGCVARRKLWATPSESFLHDARLLQAVFLSGGEATPAGVLTPCALVPTGFRSRYSAWHQTPAFRPACWREPTVGFDVKARQVEDGRRHCRRGRQAAANWRSLNACWTAAWPTKTSTSNLALCSLIANVLAARLRAMGKRGRLGRTTGARPCQLDPQSAAAPQWRSYVRTGRAVSRSNWRDRLESSGAARACQPVDQGKP